MLACPVKPDGHGRQLAMREESLQRKVAELADELLELERECGQVISPTLEGTYDGTLALSASLLAARYLKVRDALLRLRGVLADPLTREVAMQNAELADTRAVSLSDIAAAARSNSATLVAARAAGERAEAVRLCQRLREGLSS